MNTQRVLVTGGTGMTGRRITSLLQQRGADVLVGSRSGTPPFEWHDPATWAPVLDGADGVYLCFHPDLAMPGAIGPLAALASLAARRGVRRLVLLSGRGEPAAQRVEQAVREEFPDATVLRCAVFAQNFSESFLSEPVRQGTIALPAADVPEPFLDIDDLAEVATRALTEDGHAGALYELTGPRSLTFTEAAKVLGEAVGHEVVYQPVSAEEFVDGAVAAGMPGEAARWLAQLFTEILDGRNTEPADGVQRALGRPAGDFAAYVRRTPELAGPQDTA